MKYSGTLTFPEENHKSNIAYEPYEMFDRKEINHFPEIDFLTFNELIGEGTFSHVYKGVYRQKDQVAIKIIDRGSDYMINNEIDILNKLKNIPHIVQLYEVIYCDECKNNDNENGIEIENIQNEDSIKESSNTLNNTDNNENDSLSLKYKSHKLKPSSFSKLTLLVFEYLDDIDAISIYQTFTLDQIRTLLRLILEALSAAHDLGIAHRDVKLRNIIILPNFSDVKLIDWGCAAFVNEYMSPKAGSREIRPPEMLIGYHDYGCSCDIWAVGILIIYIATGGIIPWKARTSGTTLIKLSEFIGGDNIKDYAKKLNLEIDSNISDKFYDQPVTSIESEFIDCESKIYQDNELIELMKSCLTIDYKLRPSARELLQKSFFNH